jgi:filamentous hemagglutinin family protein
MSKVKAVFTLRVSRQVHHRFRLSGASRPTEKNANEQLLEDSKDVLPKSGWYQQGLGLGIALALGLGGAIAFSHQKAWAQNITTDGTLGPAQTLTGPTYNIAPELGQTVGSNLFHSFGIFNLNAGEEARFNSPDGIRNILARVTGGQASLIDGLMLTESLDVNLFFINPYGILFGPNSSLVVGGQTGRGAFVATTVDAISWPNGSQFSATNPGDANSLLTLVGDPGGFLSSARTPQPIVNLGGTLEVFDQQSLLLLGGDVTLSGGEVSAQGGRVEIAAIAGAGEVQLQTTDSDFLSLQLPANVALANITLTNAATIDASTTGDVAAGDISIQGGSVFLLDGSQITSRGENDITDDFGVIEVAALTGSVVINNNSLLSTTNFGTGFAGDISISAAEQVAINQSSVFSRGNLGRIFIGQSSNYASFSPRIVALDNATINTNAFGSAVAGGTRITASELISLSNGSEITSSSENDASDNGDDFGFVRLAATQGSVVLNNSILSATNTGDAFAGDITISARDQVSIINDSRIFSEGNFGRILIGQTNAYDDSFSPRNVGIADSFLSTSNQGIDERAGNIGIDAIDSISMARSSIDSITTSEGEAGNIFLRANGLIVLTDNSFIRADTNGSGEGGNIALQTQSLLINGGSEVLARTFGEGDAGDIEIYPIDPNAPSSVTLSGVAPFTALIPTSDGTDLVPNGGYSSGVFATSEDNATGAGGNIFINTDALRIENGGVVSARTRSNALGGNIEINVNTLEVLSGGQILTTAFEDGTAGGIEVNATGGVTLAGFDPTFYDRFDQMRDAFIAAGYSEEDAQERTEFTIDPTSPFSGLQSQALGRNSQGGGDIVIRAASLSLIDGARISADTFGTGNAGDIDIHVRDDVTLSGLVSLIRNGESFLSSSSISSEVGNTAEGVRGGNLSIAARSLFMADRSTVGVGTFGVGDAGDISIQVTDSVALSDISSIRSNVEQGGVGRGGNILLEGRSLTLNSGGQIGAIVFREENNQRGGEGQAGDITVNTSDFVTISGEAEDPFNPGQFFGSGILASTEQGAIGPGGTVTVNTNNLSIRDQGFITAETRNANNAGNVFLNVGNRLTVEDEGQVTVRGTSTGDPGNLNVIAGNIYMNRGGRFLATSASGRNANINVQVTDTVEMRRGSEISTEAFNDGSGGNINIRAGNIIWAVLPENSDIVANAFEGPGGNVTGTAQGIFGFRQAGRVRTPESEFLASSQLNIDGTVELNTQERLVQPLPIDIVDAPRLIDRRCTPARKSDASSFTSTGRGGIPSNPNDTLQNESVNTPWVTPNPTPDNNTPQDSSAQPEPIAPSTPRTSQKPVLVEAQGWMYGSKGEIILTAQTSTATPNSPSLLPSASCNGN